MFYIILSMCKVNNRLIKFMEVVLHDKIMLQNQCITPSMNYSYT
jgi:hypothetical protein